PGLRMRGKILRDWMTNRAGLLEDAIDHQNSWPEMNERARRLLRLLPKHAPSVAEDVARFANRSVPLQPCIRDIWHDHLLFEGNQLTGLIDFGSMGIDHVSCDVARLLGSLVATYAGCWQRGLDAYGQVRGLSEMEVELAQAFDRSGVLIGALNWADWTILKRRVFEEPEAVLDRMDGFLNRLENEAQFSPRGGHLLL
ncbi:MAG: phosphotransferase, partial [Thermoguttaceae bacterium]